MICRTFIAVYIKSQLILIYKNRDGYFFIFMLYKTKRILGHTCGSVSSLFMLSDINKDDKNVGQGDTSGTVSKF